MLGKISKICGGAVVFIAVCLGCAQEKKGDPLVAQVGSETISAKQLRAFIDNLPENSMGQLEVTVEDAKRHLQTMVDIELLLLEARNDDVDKSIDYLKKINRAIQTKLVTTFGLREIKVEIKENELEEYIKKEKLARAIRLGDIMLPGKEQAEVALAEIRSGKSFGQVARKWSINRKTASKGGDIGSYTTKEHMIPMLQDKLFSLAVGEVSEPIQIGERYSLFKVFDDTTVVLGPPQMMKIQKKFNKVKFDLAKAALIEGFKKEYRLQLERQGINAFVESLRRATAKDERSIVLYRYDKGEITSGDLVDAVSYLKGDVLSKLEDSEQVISLADRHVVPNIMIMEAAQRAKIDQEEDIAKWIVEQRRQILIIEFRAKVLQRRVTLTNEEVRQFYEDHPEKYMNPELLEVEEILVSTEAEALQLKNKIDNGTPLGELARTYSLRSTEVRDEEGRFHFHPFEKLQFGGFVEIAVEAEIGKLTGPVKVEEGFSIFRVLSRERNRETFDEAEWRVRSHAKREKNREAFNQYMEELRDKHQATITIREDNLKAAFGAG
jgi:parvulin-like peptidyl-prolyl isomerase